MNANIVVLDFSLFNSIFRLSLLHLQFSCVLLTRHVCMPLGSGSAQDGMWYVAYARTAGYSTVIKRHVLITYPDSAPQYKQFAQAKNKIASQRIA